MSTQARPPRNCREGRRRPSMAQATALGAGAPVGGVRSISPLSGADACVWTRPVPGRVKLLREVWNRDDVHVFLTSD